MHCNPHKKQSILFHLNPFLYNPQEAARCYASVITKRGNNSKSNKIESGQRIDSVAESLASKGCVQLEELKQTGKWQTIFQFL